MLGPLLGTRAPAPALLLGPALLLQELEQIPVLAVLHHQAQGGWVDHHPVEPDHVRVLQLAEYIGLLLETLDVFSRQEIEIKPLDHNQPPPPEAEVHNGVEVLGDPLAEVDGSLRDDDVVIGGALFPGDVVGGLQQGDLLLLVHVQAPVLAVPLQHEVTHGSKGGEPIEGDDVRPTDAQVHGHLVPEHHEHPGREEHRVHADHVVQEVGSLRTHGGDPGDRAVVHRHRADEHVQRVIHVEEDLQVHEWGPVVAAGPGDEYDDEQDEQDQGQGVAAGHLPQPVVRLLTHTSFAHQQHDRNLQENGHAVGGGIGEYGQPAGPQGLLLVVIPVPIHIIIHIKHFLYEVYD